MFLQDVRWYMPKLKHGLPISKFTEEKDKPMCFAKDINPNNVMYWKWVIYCDRFNYKFKSDVDSTRCG